MNERHWRKGGTGITNFDKKEKPIYEKAISEYGDDNFFILDRPITGITGLSSYCSLHCKEKMQTFSPFWRTFDRVYKESKV